MKAKHKLVKIDSLSYEYRARNILLCDFDKNKATAYKTYINGAYVKFRTLKLMKAHIDSITVC